MGSSTTGQAGSSRLSGKSPTTPATSAVASIPILIASGGMSSSKARSVSRTIWGDTGSTRRTPAVFCTVKAVIQATP